jgi:hypothetical protein
MQFLLISIAAGLAFGVLDAVINANPLARRLSAVYAPLAKTRVNALAGIVIDLAYGFVIAAVFLELAPALPGASGLAKGIALGAGIWFFRVVMAVASTWMTQRVPPALLGYQLVTGLGEMLVVGGIVGLGLGAG